MSQFDIDQSGLIELTEFKVLFDLRIKEVAVRIRNLSGQLIMAVGTKEEKYDSEKNHPDKNHEKSDKNHEKSEKNHSEKIHKNRRSSVPINPNRYVPPDNGVLDMRIFDGVSAKSLYYVMTARDLQQIVTVATESGHPTAMLEHAIENTKVRYLQT